jgi:hypothetical protein
MSALFDVVIQMKGAQTPLSGNGVLMLRRGSSADDTLSSLCSERDQSSHFMLHLLGT